MKLESKKLHSGYYQVKFKFTSGDFKGLYGYMLVEPETSVMDVVGQIEAYFSGTGKYGNIRTFDYQTYNSPIFINYKSNVIC